MAPSIGVNLRVTGHCNQGGRKYMEDAFVVAYQQTEDESELEYAYFGIFDGHGGREAAQFAKQHLMNNIVHQKNFWSDDDNLILKAISDGFLATHKAMWKEVAKWPKTVSGLQSTSGTTSSIAFIRRKKMYIGHVGDSKIVLGYQEPGSLEWSSMPLTKDHKPESPKEKQRIHSVGGLVMNKAGVERVVWNRPRPGHKGPIRRSTSFDQIPFLAVARSLGDLWSYNYHCHEFVVSPVPDVSVVNLDPKRDRCVIFASDGLWNMLSARYAVQIVQKAEEENEKLILEGNGPNGGVKSANNPSKLLVDYALNHWYELRMRADNTSVVTVMLDPPGPPKSEVLRKQKIMKKLRPREDQFDDISDTKKTKDLENSLLSPGKEKKKSNDNSNAKFNSGDNQNVKDRKRCLEFHPLEPAKKERRLSSDDENFMLARLPKPVILSPENNVTRTQPSRSNPISDNPSLYECEKKSPFVSKAEHLVNINAGYSNEKYTNLIEVKAKSPNNNHENNSNNAANSFNGNNLEANLVEEYGNLLYKSNDFAKLQSIHTIIKSENTDCSPAISDKSLTSQQTCSNSNNKDSGRIHLCEVDNIVKMQQRTSNVSKSQTKVGKNKMGHKLIKITRSSLNKIRKSKLTRKCYSEVRKPLNMLKKRYHRSTAWKNESLSTNRVHTSRESLPNTRSQKRIQKLKV